MAVGPLRWGGAGRGHPVAAQHAGATVEARVRGVRAHEAVTRIRALARDARAIAVTAARAVGEDICAVDHAGPHDAGGGTSALAARAAVNVGAGIEHRDDEAAAYVDTAIRAIVDADAADGVHLGGPNRVNVADVRLRDKRPVDGGPAPVDGDLEVDGDQVLANAGPDREGRWALQFCNMQTGNSDRSQRKV